MIVEEQVLEVGALDSIDVLIHFGESIHLIVFHFLLLQNVILVTETHPDVILPQTLEVDVARGLRTDQLEVL